MGDHEGNGTGEVYNVSLNTWEIRGDITQSGTVDLGVNIDNVSQGNILPELPLIMVRCMFPEGKILDTEGCCLRWAGLQ